MSDCQGCASAQCSSAEQLKRDLATRLGANKNWSKKLQEKSPEYFQTLVGIQKIEVLWVGCSDARVPANDLIGLRPGEVFVQRNVGNLATHKDMNAMSCIEYAVQVLKVKHIIVCGHYGCPAVRAALTLPRKSDGLFSLWIQDIRDTRDRNVSALRKLTGKAQEDRLVEFNVLRQVFNVCTAPVVQSAWDSGRSLAVHGMVYSLEDGELKTLYTTDSAPHQPGSFTRSASNTSLNSLNGGDSRPSWQSASHPPGEEDQPDDGALVDALVEEQRMSFEQMALKR
uniref:Carbonic anhydrase n=1 Tax=Chlorella sp. ArM0029B TaxID=1415603 RepID=A0A345AXB9_9CHLO|nr:carbonic anhydrase CAH920 [Chlorella sp. ArM0029B]